MAAALSFLLLHSGVCDRRQWTGLELPGRVVAPDLRGFGDAPVPASDWSDAEDVVALLDSLDIARCVVVGSSRGGRVAVEVAVRFPSRVERLVLLCAASPSVPPDGEAQAFDSAEEALIEAGDLDGAVELNVRTWLGPAATQEARDAVRLMQRRAFDLQLAVPDDGPSPVWADADPAAITCPTLVVSGGHDLAHFRRVAVHLSEVIPGARHVELPWAGHLPSLERPALVAALIADFCAPT